jgi:hypothetical protein
MFAECAFIPVAKVIGPPSRKAAFLNLETKNTVWCRDCVKFPRSFCVEGLNKVPHSQISEPSERAGFMSNRHSYLPIRSSTRAVLS